MRTAWCALLALLLLALPAAARADERILRYGSDVLIQKDGSLEVTETINVRAEHDAINHGIFRDFPLYYRGAHGSQFHVGFTFEGATLDGMPIAASSQSIARGIRIEVGDPNRLVEIGEHSFVIRYRARREIGFFKDYDEIYWNVTGNGWAFPIDEASVRIHLPQPVKFVQRSVYTGPQGSTGSNAQVIDEKPGEISFQTTQPLAPHEGLTVAVAFPRGVVTEPSRSHYWLADYGPIAVGLLGLLGLCAFYYVAWQRAGRDPRAGTVVPIFSPPDDLTPAAMRYITKMGADNRAFAAALVDMGVRGHIKLVEEDGGIFSPKHTRLERVTSSNPLPSEEDAALSKLCRPGESITMEQKNYQEFQSAKSHLSDDLTERYEGKLFKRNLGWAAAGALAFVAALWLAAAATAAATDSAEIWQVGLVLGSLAFCAVLWLAFHDSVTGKCFVSLISMVALALGVLLGQPIIGTALNSGWWLPLALPALALPVVITAFWWIAAPTKQGRAVLDQIAGFKQYLYMTERERLDRMTAPQDTPEVFEKYLPYAIALGVENRWADRFQSVLAAAAAQGGQHGFYWYSGTSSPWSNPGRFVDSVGSSLASSISSASAAPGSSGSGGGGSSGGGGGGGGGGGW